MKVPTIWIYHPGKKARRKVNLSDWASDLGRGHYHGWTALTDASTQGTDPKAEPPKQTVHEVTDYNSDARTLPGSLLAGVGTADLKPPKQTMHEVVSFVQEIVEKPEVVITTTQPEPKHEAPKPSQKVRPSQGRPRRGKPTP